MSSDQNWARIPILYGSLSTETRCRPRARLALPHRRELVLNDRVQVLVDHLGQHRSLWWRDGLETGGHLGQRAGLEGHRARSGGKGSRLVGDHQCQNDGVEEGEHVGPQDPRQVLEVRLRD